MTHLSRSHSKRPNKKKRPDLSSAIKINNPITKPKAQGWGAGGNCPYVFSNTSLNSGDIFFCMHSKHSRRWLSIYNNRVKVGRNFSLPLPMGDYDDFYKF